MIIGHGGNKQQLADVLGCPLADIVDMSSNLNPLGPPQRIEQVIINNLGEIRSLPEPDAASMVKGFADFHQVSQDRVVAGNGTTWFIYTLPKALNAKKILIVGPTYSDYRDAAAMHNRSYDHFLLSPENDFLPDEEALFKKAGQADLVFICNPNNPTGTLFGKPFLKRLLQKHEQTLFVVDESYLPFVSQAKEISLVSDIEYPNLAVLSSMSKIFQIPGLRTGFLRSTRSICDRVKAFYQPWSVNSLAQAVIRDIFDHPGFIPQFYKETQEYIRAEKQIFLDSIADVDALYCYPGATYFILARLTGSVSSKGLCDKIGQHKILIRDCANFEGLTDAFVRFSLKDRPQNMRLAALIKESLTNG
jgi:threonine-phosphate decarboxylase